MVNNLSAVIITKNEEDIIARCIKHLSWCHSIFLIDDNSTDKTTEVAKKMGVKVFTRSLNDDFASQRNWALSKVKTKWTLFIDADEVVTDELAREIEEAIAKSQYLGFWVTRKDFWLGRKMNFGEFGKTKFLRLARTKGGKWRRAVHETWEVSGRKESLKNELYHYPHPTVGKFLEHINFHSTLHAIANQNEGKKSSIYKIFLYPPAKFFKNYLLRGGFLDGTQGLVAACLMSFHSFLAWSKLWLYEKKYQTIG